MGFTLPLPQGNYKPLKLRSQPLQAPKTFPVLKTPSHAGTLFLIGVLIVVVLVADTWGLKGR